MRSISRFLLWLVMIALGLTVFLALLPVPIERTAVDATAASSDSDYVTVHGLPRYFLVTDSSVQHTSSPFSLVASFLYDWAFFFAAVSVIVLAIMFIALVARLAARTFLLIRR